MRLFKALDEIGLIPAHQWPVPDADLHRNLEKVEADLETAFIEERTDYRGNYEDGRGAGEASAVEGLKVALGIECDGLADLIAKAKALKAGMTSEPAE
jgi:hypothetical protein